MGSLEEIIIDENNADPVAESMTESMETAPDPIMEDLKEVREQAPAPKKSAMGKGLAALMGGDEEEDYANLDRARGLKQVSTNNLYPGASQPRFQFDDEALDQLAQSIKEKGILQPILVRRSKEKPENYEIVAGERRWRAAKMIGLNEVPIIIKDIDDRTALEIALIENIQREELKALEEAEGFRQLMEEYQYSQEDVARIIGKSRSHIANTIRLLALPDRVKQYLQNGKISAGHARALLGSRQPEQLVEMILQKGLTVRDVEKEVQKEQSGEPVKRPRKAKEAKEDQEWQPIPSKGGPKTDEVIALERDISKHLGLKVMIELPSDENEPSQTPGFIQIQYHTLDQLDDVLHILAKRKA